MKGYQGSSHLAAVDSVVLISFDARVFQVSPHLHRRLRYLIESGVFELARPDHIIPRDKKERIASQPVEFRQDATPVDGNPGGAPHFQQDVHQPEGKQPAAVALKRAGQIREG